MLVSIIIPCYNQQNYISETLNSVLNQTYTNWECIIVNDGSTDNSESIINEYVEKDKRFCLLNQENKGVAAARNHGFLKAKGSLIQFLDSDDILLPEKIKEQVNFLTKHKEIDIVYNSFFHLYQINGHQEEYISREVSENSLNDFLFYWDRGLSIPPHAPLFRRSVWKSDEFPYPEDYNERYEDWVFWILIALKGPKFKYIHNPLVIYRIHETSFCSDAFKLAVHMLNAAHYIKNIIPENLKKDFWEQTVEHVLNENYKRKALQDNIENYILKVNRHKLKPIKPIISFFSGLKKR